MIPFDLKPILKEIVSLSRQASVKILEIYDRDFKVDFKDDESPLTEADIASHRCLIGGIKDLALSFPIISEEAVELVTFEQRKIWPTYWLIDPLDGTKEFIKRNGEFTVNVALIHEHKPILGVVYVPVKDQCYFASLELGAFKQVGNETPIPIKVREHVVGKINVVGSRSHKTGGLADFVERLGEYNLISMGSSLKLCLVAEGVADVYPRIGPTSEWDTAAAHCVVEQAGGSVTDIDGNRLLYNTKESFLNPHFLVFGDRSINWAAYVN